MYIYTQFLIGNFFKTIFIIIYLLVFVLELRGLFLEVYLVRQAIVFLFLDRLSPVDTNPINDSTCTLIIALICLM